MRNREEGMKVSERVFVMAEASDDITDSISTITKKYDLTLAELCLILSAQLQINTSSLVREERQRKVQK